MKLRISPLAAPLMGAALLFGFGFRAYATTYPSNTTYYINYSSGNDGNNGTSTSTPWKTFNNVNGNTFSEGDQILLATENSWSQELSPLGSGVSGNPITIGCYGSTCSTNYPVINAGSSNPSVYLVNPSWWTLTNLTLTGSNDGVWVHFSQLENQGLVFQNLYVYDLNGSSPSIVFDGYNSNPPTSIPSNEYIISDVIFRNIGIYNAGAIDLIADYANAQQVNNGYPNAQQNIVMENVYANDYKGCFGIANAENVTAIDSFWQDGDADGSCGAATYMVAISNVIFNNGIYYDDPFTNGSDNGAFVYDNQETEIRWRGDYFYENSASGIEGAENLCFAGCTSSTNSDFEVSSSTFYDNSTQDECTDPNNSSATYGFYGDISVAYSPETQMTVQNNLYSDTSQACNAFVNRLNSSYQTLTNNTNFGSNGLYNSRPRSTAAHKAKTSGVIITGTAQPRCRSPTTPPPAPGLTAPAPGSISSICSPIPRPETPSSASGLRPATAPLRSRDGSSKTPSVRRSSGASLVPAAG